MSPTQYNICQQIPIFRLELDPQFKSVFQHFLKPTFPFSLPFLHNNQIEKFKNESARETDKVEGFADDTYGLGLRSRENISVVKNILIDFSKISGLHCNFNKTCVMPVGPNKSMNEEESCLLKVKNSITVLGMKIDNNLSDLHVNFDDTLKKMQKFANFWNRFKLSLPGRIAIAKTFLFSLINHIGCFLMPLDHQIIAMQSIADKFCLGTLNIGKDHLYSNPNKGGLGLICIRDFLISQHTIWIKRAGMSSRDNWRVDLHTLGWGNPFTISPSTIAQHSNPILYGLSQSFSTFNAVFSATEKNYKKAYILNNPLFCRGNRDSNIIDCTLFNKNANLYEIAKLRFCDFFVSGSLKSFVQLNLEYNLNLQSAPIFLSGQ